MTTRLSLTATPGRPYAAFAAKTEAVALSVMTLKGLDALTGDDLLMIGVAIYHGNLRDIGTNTHAQIDAHIASVWAKNTANGVTLTKGGSASTVTDLQVASDGNVYHVDEVNDSPHIQLVVDFAAVTAFNWVNIIGGYKGVTSHMVGIQVEITPFDGSAWYTYSCMDHHGTLEYLEDYSFFVPDDSIHINSGVVKVGFVHTTASPGNTSHDMELDVVALYQ